MKPGNLNARSVHLSWIKNGDEPTNLEEGLPDAQLFAVRIEDDHFSYIVQFSSTGTTPKGYSTQQKKESVVQATNFSVITRHLYKMGYNELLRRYVPEYERQSILIEAHGGFVGGNYAGRGTA